MGWTARQGKSLAEAPTAPDERTELQVFLGMWKAAVTGTEYQCHTATRLAAATLRQLGFRATPLSVYIEVARQNNPHVKIGVSPEISTATVEEIGPGLWYGHLVLIVSGCWLVDVSCGQFTSVRDQIQAPSVLQMAWPDKPGPRSRFQCEIHDLTLTYWPRQDDNELWRLDWHAPLDPDEEHTIAALLEAHRSELRRRSSTGDWQ